MFAVSHLTGFNTRLKQVEISQTDAAVDTTDTTAYTFSGAALGAAHSNRKILVGIVATDAGNDTTVSTVTVGGISASLETDGSTTARAINTSDTNSHVAEFWIASVPTGTTGDIVVTMSEASTNCGIVVYRLLNAAIQSVVIDVATTYSQAITVNGFGAIIGLIHLDDDTTCTWTNLTEDVDATIETAQAAYSSASLRFPTGGSKTITATPASVNNDSMVLVAYKPL